ncbi:exodeoxyribonuclease V subunit alpha [Nocardioidaceae bacterium SCSIO 66511]|nr:exodeoxyribonuclease V subunit alpha [Nocardioidaceae bacterium SCSIO 66511]
MTAGDLDLRYDAQRVPRATGLLAEFNRAGVLAAADVHVAEALGRLGGEDSAEVLLAAAMAVRSVRLGSACVDLSTVQDTTVVEDVAIAELAWPTTASWCDAVARSPLIASGGDDPVGVPLRLEGSALYLDRYWRDERLVAETIDATHVRTPPTVDEDRLGGAVARLFGEEGADRQRLAAVIAVRRWFSVIAGGPGTGKTTTVARLLALLADQPGPPPRIALAAPTGRAAARLFEAVTSVSEGFESGDRDRVSGVRAQTLHRLLGWKPGSRTRFRHDNTNPLPYDAVIVDEASMVSLTMMARLVDALRTDARLVLVGDPDQLASVEVGAVLGDLVRRDAVADTTPVDTSLVERDVADLDSSDRHAVLASGVVRLSHVYRFSGEIESLAEGVRAGDSDAVLALLDRGSQSVELVAEDSLGALRADVARAGGEVVGAARAGEPALAVDALGGHRLLCAHREGPYGVARWSLRVEEWLRDDIGGYGADGTWYVGRPLLVTANDYRLGLFNGDTGVVVDVDGAARAAFRRAGGLDVLPTNRLAEVQTMHAMSVHRSQGSQFDRVTLILPPSDSPILTRELLYTAVTRAKEHVRIVGTREALALAIERPIVRASGLRTR